MFLVLLLTLTLVWCADKKRVVTKEELATKTGKDGAPIWLAIMGEVYDVSAGSEYYADGSGYHIFAGREGNVPFITGTFTPEESEKSVETLKPADIGSLDHWREFYEKEEKYPFVGLVVGEFYDENGDPTEVHKKIKAIAEEEKVKQEIRKKEREARIAERKKRKDAELKKKQADGMVDAKEL